jgi:hypothetical protein
MQKNEATKKQKSSRHTDNGDSFTMAKILWPLNKLYYNSYVLAIKTLKFHII